MTIASAVVAWAIAYGLKWGRTDNWGNCSSTGRSVTVSTFEFSGTEQAPDVCKGVTND
jgi:hypothetical protein